MAKTILKILASKGGRTKHFTQLAWSLLDKEKFGWSYVRHDEFEVLKNNGMRLIDASKEKEPVKAAPVANKVSLETPVEVIKKIVHVDIASDAENAAVDPMPVKTAAKKGPKAKKK
jgi:phosphoserine aminotransferase